MTGTGRAHHEKFVGLAVLLATLVAVPSALAQSIGETSSVEMVVTRPESAVEHLRWTAPEECPAQDEVRSLALERMRSLPEDAPLLLIEVAAVVSSSELGFEATLRAGDVERHFTSPSCLTIARSVGLVFSEWVVEGPVAAPEVSGEPPTEPTPTEPTPTEPTPTEPTPTEPTPTEPTPAEPVSTDPPIPPPSRAPVRFVGGFLLGYDAFAMPVVEPTAFLSLGIGIDVLEIDVAPMGLGLTNFGLGAAEDARMLLYGGRLRVGVMFELSPEWELGGHLLTEVALITISRDTDTSRAIFGTFGAGLDLRFFPIPMVGVGFSVQVPFPVTKATLSLPTVGLTYEQDWATLVMGLGVVVRIP